MREIKFRAWDGVVMRHTWDGWSSETDILEEVWKDAEDYGAKLMQYTGLKDKNGKEIYEGDILQRGVIGDKLKVIYEQGCFVGDGISAVMFHSTPIKFVLAEYLDEIEVIGNIYEHPELIGDSDERDK